jgi:hypothetical protein
MAKDIIEETTNDTPDTEFDITALFRLPEVRAQMQGLVDQAVKQAVRETVVAMNPAKAPLTMRANVADRFITGSNSPSGNTSPHLKHYRCERLKSDKIVEIDMDRLMSYLGGEKEVPENKEGNLKSIMGLSVKRGQWISFLNGHCYAYTENQVKQLEWMKTQPRDKGGLPDLYEDPGGEVYRCNLCPGLDPFGTKAGWDMHMQHVHGMVVDPSPGVVPPLFANTSPDPFTNPIR